MKGSETYSRCPLQMYRMEYTERIPVMEAENVQISHCFLIECLDIEKSMPV